MNVQWFANIRRQVTGTIVGAKNAMDVNIAGGQSDVIIAGQSGPAIEVSVVGLSGVDVIDFLDTPVLDAAVTNVPASSSLPVQVVASLAAAVKRIKINDTIGKYIGVYSGAVSSEVLQCIVGPGEDGFIDVVIDAGSRVSLRHMDNSVINLGELCIQFIG